MVILSVPMEVLLVSKSEVVHRVVSIKTTSKYTLGHFLSIDVIISIQNVQNILLKL